MTAKLNLLLFISSSHLLAGTSLSKRVIVLDPGHATVNYEGTVINPGRVSKGGVKECKVAMAISQKLGALLEKEGATVYYTRTPHDFWREAYNNQEDNKARAAFANQVKANAFLAIHCDWDPRPRVHGVTTYYEKDKGRALGNLLQKNMVKQLDARNRSLIQDHYTVLDVAEMPAVIVETGFISNRSESKKLGDSKYQNRVAAALATGLKDYFAALPRP